MKCFSMPADFKHGTIDAYHMLNQKETDTKVIDTYGSITTGDFFGSGRPPQSLPSVDFHRLEQYVQHSRQRDISFCYTLNAANLNNVELTDMGIERITRFLKSIHDIGVTSVTISSPPLFDIVKNLFPEIYIKVSTINQIDNINKASAYRDIGADAVVMPEYTNYNFDLLKGIKTVFDDNIELIVNGLCTKDCIWRAFHYNQIALDSPTHKSEFNYYECKCSQRMIKDPSHFMKFSWIRPEDMCLYEQIGIKYFKVQGRHAVNFGYPIKFLSHYIKEHYEGDLIDLIWLFSKHYIPTAVIDNKSLDGFIEPFFKTKNFCKNSCATCQYCASFLKRAILSDVTKFEKFIISENFDRFSFRLRKEL